MRIQETNQILKDTNVERLDLARHDAPTAEWMSSRSLGISVAVAAAVVAAGVALWQWRRTPDVSLFKL